MTRLRRVWLAFRRWGGRLAVLAAAGGIIAAVLIPDRVLPPLAHHLDVTDPPARVDYVLVLNGDPETRPFAAAAYYRAGLARRVLLTRQRPSIEPAAVQAGGVPTELEVTRRVLHARGVPEADVRLLPGEIASTADEAYALAGLLDAEPGVRVAVVTNDFHTRRTRQVFRRALGERAAGLQVWGVPREGAPQESWWRSPQGCTVYASEYAKLGYYWLRY